MTDHFERALQERLLARSQVSPRDVEALRLFARTLPARRSLWQRPSFQWAMSAAAIVLAAVVALPLLFNAPGFGGETPAPSPTATPAPTAPEPTIGPAPTPALPVATPLPSIGLGPVRLTVSSGSIVNVTIDDPDGYLVGAVAERANADMSFAWGNSSIETVAPNAIRVTWVGYPRDEEVRLEVTEMGDGGIGLHFFQDAPIPNTDGEGEDRVIILTFTQNVDPADLAVRVTDPTQ
jgi:hypothetical protein